MAASVLVFPLCKNSKMTGNFAPPAANPVAGRTEDETNASGSSSLRRRMYFTGLGLAGLGALDSAYLTYVKFAGAHAACGGIGDCETVNNSAFSAISGVPIAILGLAAYLAIIALFLLERSHPANAEYSRLAAFGVTLIGTIYSGWLTYVEVSILHAICPFCVASAIIISLLFLISVHRMLANADTA